MQAKAILCAYPDRSASISGIIATVNFSSTKINVGQAMVERGCIFIALPLGIIKSVNQPDTT